MALYQNQKTRKSLEAEANVTIGLYLAEESQKEVAEWLKNEYDMFNTESKIVVLKRGPDDQEEFITSALYGQPCAFRLKGLIRTERGAVATGVVSTMGGKLKMSNYSISMPIVERRGGKQLPIDLKESMDMATRVSLVSGGKAPWKGSVPQVTTGSGVTYPKVAAQLDGVPLSKQLVVGGTLCSSKYALPDGTCNFQLGSDERKERRATAKDMVESNDEVKGGAAATVVVGAKGAAAQQSSTSGDGGGILAQDAAPGDENKDDNPDGGCPICAFVKKGSCRVPFELLQKYHDMEGKPGFDEDAYKRVAEDMYACMSKDEYYDAFVLDLKRQQQQESQVEAEKK